ncbi:hypothetical protein Tco_0281379, partial [Tanacetum coccineum]
SASSAVTYTFVYTDSEPGRVFWGADEEISDRGPKEPQTLPVPQDEDEREPMFIQPHDPDYVPEPIYPEYIPLEDEHVFPVEEQPLPHVDSPTVESPGYVAESDPEEYEDDETEDGPVDYPMDGGEDEDDDDGDSSRDDVDDEDEDEGHEDDEDEEEEEHLALADSVVVVPTIELVSPLEGTYPVIPPPSTDITTTGARITVRIQASISLPPEAEFVEEPVEIMEREIKRLKRSWIKLVKVRWNSRRGPEFTWEREDSFKQKYPQLFTNRASSSTTRS